MSQPPIFFNCVPVSNIQICAYIRIGQRPIKQRTEYAFYKGVCSAVINRETTLCMCMNRITLRILFLFSFSILFVQSKRKLPSTKAKKQKSIIIFHRKCIIQIISFDKNRFESKSKFKVSQTLNNDSLAFNRLRHSRN